MKQDSDKFHKFLQTHQVFNTGELEEHCSVSGYHLRNLLTKFVRNQEITKVRNGLYSVLPEGTQSDFMPPALLVAAKSTSDAVLGYRSALAFYGLSRNTNAGHTFLTHHRLKPYKLNGITFKPCSSAKPSDDFSVVNTKAWNTPVRVVSKERLLVDSLNRLDLAGGWEEVVNAFQYENNLDYSVVVRYLKLLDNPATSARVGFFLEQFQDDMNVPEAVLLKLEALKPKNAEHFYRSRREGKLLKRWNLYVPDALLTEKEENYEF